MLHNTRSVQPLGRRFHVHLATVSLANLADGALMVAVPLLAVTVTRSPREIALLETLFWLPWLIFGLLAGVIIDRTDRLRVRIISLTLRVILVLGLIGWHFFAGLSIAVLVAFMGLYGLTQVFADLAARTMVPQLAPASRLDAANGRTMAAEQVFNNFIGAPVAGVLVIAGVGWALGVPAAACALAVLLLIVGLRGSWRAPHVEMPATPDDDAAAPAAAPPAATSRLRDVFDGVKVLLAHPVLRPVVVMACIANLATTAYGAVFVLWMVGEESAVGLTPAQYPLLAVASAAGAVVGSFTVEALVKRIPAVPLMLWSWMIQAPLMVVPVIFPHFPAILVSVTCIGFLNMTGNTLAHTLLQKLIPAHQLGRALGALSTFGFGLMPLGALLGGVIGEHYGLPVVFVSAAGLLAVAVLYPLVSVRKAPLTV